MARVVRVWIWSVKGEPLIMELADDPAYQRNEMGFRPPSSRESKHESPSGVGVVRPPDKPSRVDGQAEGLQVLGLQGEEEEGKEGVS